MERKYIFSMAIAEPCILESSCYRYFYRERQKPPDDATHIEDGHFGKNFVDESQLRRNLRNFRSLFREFEKADHTDLSMLTRAWVVPSDEEEHIKLRSNGESKRVKWDPIQSWSLSRSLASIVFELVPLKRIGQMTSGLNGFKTTAT